MIEAGPALETDMRVRSSVVVLNFFGSLFPRKRYIHIRLHSRSLKVCKIESGVREQRTEKTVWRPCI